MKAAKDGAVYKRDDGIVIIDPEKAKADEVELAVQINGKVKARITVAADSAEEDIIAKALEAAANAVEGKTVVKKIVIPGRLVNIVVK